MFITTLLSKGKGRKSYTSILLRQSIRVGSKVKSKTVAVLTHLPPHVLAAVRRAIAQSPDSLSKLAEASEGSLHLRHGQSMGAIWVVDQIAQQLGIKQALGVTGQATLSYWQVLARVLRPRTSLLAMVRLGGSCATIRFGKRSSSGYECRNNRRLKRRSEKPTGIWKSTRGPKWRPSGGVNGTGRFP